MYTNVPTSADGNKVANCMKTMNSAVVIGAVLLWFSGCPLRSERNPRPLGRAGRRIYAGLINLSVFFVLIVMQTNVGLYTAV